MKHLFIINPVAAGLKGRVDETIRAIEDFFADYQQLEYSYHVTRWCRDALGYVHRFVRAEKDMVRVYALGGTGTLFEVINGVVGMPNVQVAFYPLGRSNAFVYYFGLDKTELFMSIRNLVFSDTTPIDLVRCGHHFFSCFSSMGIESFASRDGDILIERTQMPAGICYAGSAVYHLLGPRPYAQHYHIVIRGESGETVLDGYFATLLIAKTPFYTRDFCPAVDAHPNNGRFDVYAVRARGRWRLVATLPAYLSGDYKRHPGVISHHSGEKITITSEEPICFNLDGEVFYNTRAEMDIIPYALDFVLPKGIDLASIPLVYDAKGRR